MGNESWMSRIQNDPQLTEMVIPGSHDAGVYGDSLSTVKSPESWARCQGSDIYDQAVAGSRMFDCRVFLKKDPKTKALEPTMGHFFWETAKGIDGATGTGGAYGGTLGIVVADAIDFVHRHPTEFIILRFSHTYCPEEVGNVLKDMWEHYGKGYIYTERKNIALCRLSELRGKIVMVFASEFHKNFKVEDGYLPFYKYNTNMNITSGLATCGIFNSTNDMAKVTSTAEQAAKEHQKHPENHLHFVYWQQTGGNVKENTTDKQKGTHAKLGGFIEEIREKMDNNNNGWKLPNIISHDFVNEQTCTQIIELNPFYQRP